MIGTAIDTTKSWNTMLNRVCFGGLVIAIAENFGLLSAEFGFSSIIQNSNSAAAVPLAVFLFLASLLTGSIVLMVGNFGSAERFGEQAKVVRAMRVGNTGNGQLISQLSDANNRHEIGSGFAGTLVITLVFFLATVFAYKNIPSFPFIPEATHEASGLITFVFGGLGGLTGLLIKRSSLQGIEAMDAVLDKHYPLAEHES